MEAFVALEPRNHGHVEAAGRYQGRAEAHDLVFPGRLPQQGLRNPVYNLGAPDEGGAVRIRLRGVGHSFEGSDGVVGWARRRRAITCAVRAPSFTDCATAPSIETKIVTGPRPIANEGLGSSSAFVPHRNRGE
jgi:hypothetical protein